MGSDDASARREETYHGRLAARVLGILIAIAFVPFAIACAAAPVSLWGTGYLSGVSLVLAGMVTSPARIRRWRGVTRVGLALTVAIAALRMFAASDGEHLTMITLPGEGGCDPINRLIEEEDGVMLGAVWLPRIGVIDPREGASWGDAMRDAYRRMHEEEGTTPSPVIATYLGMQDADGFDAIVLEPEGGHPPHSGIVFLHGYAGSFTSLCWMATRGARQAGLLAVCPSAGPAGDWWRRPYHDTVRESVRYLRRRGVEHVYLGGLSNGGIGASRLAPRLARELDLAGLILISGAAPDGGTGGMPTLIVQGADDDMTPPEHARSLLARARPRPTYVELPGSHFLLAERLDEVSGHIRDWLQAQFPPPRSAP